MIERGRGNLDGSSRRPVRQMDRRCRFARSQALHAADNPVGMEPFFAVALHEHALHPPERMVGQKLQHADVLPRAGRLAVTPFQSLANFVENRRQFPAAKHVGMVQTGRFSAQNGQEMPRIENLFARAVRPQVPRNGHALRDDLDRIDVALDRHRGKRKPSRHAVTVAVQRDRLILVRLRFLVDTRIEAMLRQRKSRLAISLEAAPDRFALTACRATAIVFAAPQEIGVQFAEVFGLGDRRCPASLKILHAVLHARLLVAASWHAKQRLEVVVAGKRGVAIVQLPPTPFEDLRRHRLGVVPPDFPRHATEELEGGLHPVQNRFGPLGRQGHHERAIGIRPCQQQHGNLSATVGKVDVDVAEIDFDPLARIVRKRNERLTPAAAILRHVTPYLIVAARVALFGQTTKDLHRRMTLFRRLVLVAFENLINPRLEPAQLRRFGRSSARVRPRLGLLDHLPHFSP